jgi:spore germination cell wall hydrolase CwlJ-like protein
MSFSIRAASTSAAVLICGVVLAAGAAPSFAQQAHSASFTTLNALTLQQVPVAPEVAPLPATPQIVPAIVPTEVADDAVVVAELDQPEYDSLADAVAAQDVAADDRELQCLASGVYFEAKGEPLAGQLAVAETILNRTRSGRFPKTVCSVLTQRGQFSFVRGGHVPTGAGRAWRTAVAVAKVAQADLWDSAADDALFFHARHVSPGWRMAKVAAIGNHIFYR